MVEHPGHRPGLEHVDVEADVSQLRLDEPLDGSFVSARRVGLRRYADEVRRERDQGVALPVDLSDDPFDDRWGGHRSALGGVDQLLRRILGELCLPTLG